MILTTLLAAASLCAGPAQLPLQTTTSEDTAEGAEILRRIVVDVLDDAFDRRQEDSTTKVERLERLGVVTTLWAHRETVQHSRVFHLPGAGLFFALDVALPVVSREADDGQPERSKEVRDDEWERARRELRGGGEAGIHMLGTRKLEKSEIDPKAIDQVVDHVLRTIARHAVRIEGLAPQESITLALRLSGRANTVWSDLEGKGDDDGEGVGEAHAWTSEAYEELGRGAFNFVLAGSSSAREQTLVIRVALADLAGAGEGSLERLRQRAQINRY